MASSPGPLPRRLLRSFLVLALVLAAGGPLSAQYGRDAVMELTATTSATAPHITLSWPLPPGLPLSGNPPKLWRRVKGQTGWGTAIILSDNATSYTDATAQPGVVYEYSLYFWRSTGTILRYGAIAAGHNIPLVEHRGNALLYVDASQAVALGGEIDQLVRNLAADGWRVIRHDGPRGVVSNASTNSADYPARLAERTAMRSAIRSHYDTDPTANWALFIIGRVPVAYSGNTAPDGHAEHVGAWPTDTCYADIDGVWTDTTVNNTAAQSTRNDNVPGDGKFDHSTVPSDVELQTGRVDFAGMTTTPVGISETELLRQYLVRNHRFRRGLAPYDNVARRIVVSDTFTDSVHANSAYASAGWRAGIAFFGNQPGQADAAPWLPTLATDAALLAVGAGAGTYTSMGGVGDSTFLGSIDFKGVFTMSFGSYFGDWDNSNNFLRTPIAGTAGSLGLACLWSGRGYFHLQHMALGEPIGYAVRFTQNNTATTGDWNQNSYHRSITYNLLGDPTLRLHTVRPPSRVVATPGPSGVVLNWTASPDASAGHHIYRATDPAGPYTRLTGVPATAANPTGSPLAGTTHVDTTAVSDAEYTYLVKAVKIETSASGTYANQSLGESATLAYLTGDTTTPAAPTGLAATATGTTSCSLSWQDNAANETGFELQRRDPATGAWSSIATLPANRTTHTDITAPAGKIVHYRLRATGTASPSAWSATAADPTLPGLAAVTSPHLLVNKTSGSAAPALRRFNGDRGAASVGSTLTNLLGAAGTDYASSAGPVSWAHGVGGEATHAIAITAHATPQLTKLFRVNYANPTNGLALNTPVAAFVQIQDPATQTLPAGWSTATFGSVPWTGYAEYLDGVFGLSARTGNLTGGTTSDSFRFVYMPVTGDCEFTARVVFHGTALNGSPRAGLMIRDTLAANSRFKAIFFNESVAAEIYRANPGGTSASTVSSGAALPGWLRVTRVGNDLRAFRSTNGTTWTEVGATRTLALASTAHVGLFLASNSSGTGGLPGYARFDNITLSAELAAPARFTAAPGPQPGEIALAWNAVPSADTYHLERSTTAPDSGFTFLAAVTGALTHTDTQLNPGLTHHYRIKSMNTMFGAGSGWSAPASSTPFLPTGTLAGWRYTYFHTNDTTRDAANSADPDGDGIPNLAEYARGLSPLAADTGVINPVVGRTSLNGDDYLTLTFDRDMTVADIALTVQTAGDLAGSWTTFDPLLPDHQLAVFDNTPAPGRQTLTVRDTLPLSSTQPRRFMRLRYEWKDPSAPAP